MIENTGYIKLWRKFTSWEWHDNPNVVTLFIHCLLMANWEDKRWQGKEIHRGEFVTSYNHLADETGLTIKQVRTALQKLEDSGEIVANKSRGRNHTFIRVCKFDEYQEGQIKDKLKADKGQIKGKKRATTKEYKEYKEDKNNKAAAYYPDDDKLNQAFTDYVNMRKKIKAPMTDRAIELAINKLEKLSGGDNNKATAILEQSVMNSWKGLFELKNETNAEKPKNNKFNNFSGRSYSNEQLERLIGG